MHNKGKPAWIYTQSVLQKVKSAKKIRVCSSKNPVVVWHLFLPKYGGGVGHLRLLHTHFYQPCSHRLWASIQFFQGHFYSPKLAKNPEYFEKFWTWIKCAYLRSPLSKRLHVLRLCCTVPCTHSSASPTVSIYEHPSNLLSQICLGSSWSLLYFTNANLAHAGFSQAQKTRKLTTSWAVFEPSAPPIPTALQSPFMSIHPICSGSFLQQ